MMSFTKSNFLPIIFIFATLFMYGQTPENSKKNAPCPKLIDLGAQKCVACKKMVPVLEALEKEYQGVLDIEFIDVWKAENKDKAKAYGILAIPTQIFFSAQGKELWRHEGFISKEDILAKWKELGHPILPPGQKKQNPTGGIERAQGSE